MAFISNKERARRIQESNQTYFIRKILLSVTVGFIALMALITIISLSNTFGVIRKYKDTDIATLDFIKYICNAPLSFFSYSNLEGGVIKVSISGFGIFMIIWAVITIGIGVTSLVFIFMMKSPKSAKKNINVLQGAALSGKKIDTGDNATEIYRERGGQIKKSKKK